MRRDPFMKSEIVRATGKSYPTVLRWIANNDEMLTLKSVVDLVKKNYEMAEDQIFEMEEA